MQSECVDVWGRDAMAWELLAGTRLGTPKGPWVMTWRHVDLEAFSEMSI